MNFDSTRAINYVEFVTTTDGGRFVGKANIEYLNEAGQWIVAGSISSDDFQDGATSITFEEVKAKGIRFVVTEAGSTNWLKVAEFNAVNTNAKNIITVNGVGETKLNDMDMRTFVNPTGEGEIVYNVYESAKVNSLRIYNAAGQWDGVSVYAVTEDSLKVLKEKIVAVEALLADMAIGEPVTQEALDAAMADMVEAVNNLEAVEGAFEMGDVNHSGIVDIDDATLIQMHLAKTLGNTAFYKENADYSKDGKITVYDATLIQLMLAS